MSKPKMFIEALSTGSKATIRIVDRIYEWSDSSSATIRQIVDDFIKNGISDVEVYINTKGGDCFEAEQMCNELDRLSKAPTVEVGALAASAGSYFLTRYVSEAHPNSQIMIHRPHMGIYGDVTAIESNLKLLKNLTELYKTAYATKMEKTPDEIEALFALGDYWMTAKEALDMGLINSISSTAEEITEDTVQILEACAAPIIPKINKPKKEEMDRLKLIAQLKLSADATDAQIEAALNELQVKAGTATTLEAQVKAKLDVDVIALVDGAILKDKKITADLRETYIGLATANFEATKKAIDGMSSISKPNDFVEPIEGDQSAVIEAARKEWTLDDYLSKAPEALQEMISTNPTKFKQLEADYLAK